jgi:pimeloyl-ACP methyl ester carboxylesterase
MNLVFIHGAGSSKTVWGYQKHYFSAHDVTLIDLPGHGGKAGAGRETISEYVEDVRKECEYLEDVILIGHSMGGAITMLYGLLYPVRACVLAGTGARLRVLPAVLENIKKAHEETVDFILEYAVHNKTEEIMRKSKKEMVSISPDVLYKDFSACDNFDVMQKIASLDIPTLVVCGSEDLLTPVKYAEYLAAHIPLSTLKIIDDCGHMLMLEKPQEFNQILGAFLENV